nr:cell division protein CrgA [Brevibacterium sp. XM4083]
MRGDCPRPVNRWPAPGVAVEGVLVAKSHGRTSRPQRTTRNAAKAKTTADDATVVDETDIEVTEVVDADGTETDVVIVDEVEVVEDDADEKSTAAAKSETTSAKDDAKDDAETDSDEDDNDSATTDSTSTDSTAKDSATKDTAVSKGTAKSGAAKSTAASKEKSSAKEKSAKKAGAKRTTRSGNPAKRSQGRKTASYTSEAGQQTIKPNPRWFLPVLIGLLLIGLIWLVTFYITQGAFPVEAWGNWNILIGFAFFVAGLIMSTRWR